MQTLPLQVAQRIGAGIIDGSYPPGSRLRENELSELFDVSRATIREALRLVEKRGLVRIQPQRGAHVTQLSAQELEDLFEVRTSLLATGSRLAAERCTQEMAMTLQTLLERLRLHVDDVDAYVSTSAEMVHRLVHMSGNVVLANYIDDFAMRIGRYARMGLHSTARRKRSLATWVQLVGAVIQRDGPAAAAHHARLAQENRCAALEVFKRHPHGGLVPADPPFRDPTES